MSAKPAKAPEGDAAEAPKKGKKKLIIILAVVLLLVLGGGGAAFFLLKGEPEEGDEEHAAEVEKGKEKEKDKAKKKKKGHAEHPVFMALDPFTVNLIPEQGDQYLQVALSAELDDPTSEAEVKAIMPKIRNGVTLLLSSKKASEISSKEGKEKLAEEIMDQVNTLIEPPKKGRKPEGPVQAILFTSFIIQ